MWARYVPFYLCQCMRSVRYQSLFTLSQHQKKVVSDSFEVHLKVSKYVFLIFHFCHWLKLDLVRMAKLACDQLCQRTLHIRQQIASAHCAYGSKLLLHTVHAVAKSCKTVFFASICCACGSTLLPHTALTVANCQRMLRIRQQVASVCFAYSSNLVAYTAHTVTNRQIFCALLAHAAYAVANCQRRRRMRQQKQSGPYLTHL